MIDSIIAMVNDLDPEKLLPDLQKLLSNLAPIARGAVLVGPAALLLLGIVYAFFAPKEANHRLGFRCWWGMGSVEVWRFTQKLAGFTWIGLGLILGVVMHLISDDYAELSYDEMLFGAAKAIGWQIAAVIVSSLVINIVLIILFNHKGERRRRRTPAPEAEDESELQPEAEA